MYFDTSLKTSRRDYSGLWGEDRKRGDGVSSSGGSDPAKDPFEGIDDPTLRVQMQHEMRDIEKLAFVTKLSSVPVDITCGYYTW